jgi:hypothetical protein
MEIESLGCLPPSSVACNVIATFVASLPPIFLIRTSADVTSTPQITSILHFSMETVKSGGRGVGVGTGVVVGVLVGVGVSVGVLVGVLVGVGVSVGVLVGVLVDVGVSVGVLVGVLAGVGVFVGALVGV